VTVGRETTFREESVDWIKSPCERQGEGEKRVWEWVRAPSGGCNINKNKNKTGTKKWSEQNAN